MKRQLFIVADMFRSLWRNKSEQKTLYLEEIGWTMTVPPELRILSEKQVQGLVNKSAKNHHTPFDLKNPDKDHGKVAMARNFEGSYLLVHLYPTANRCAAEIREEFQKLRILAAEKQQRSHAAYSRVRVEDSLHSGTIGQISFDRIEVITRIPGRILSWLYIYHTVYKGYVLYISIGFRNASFGHRLLDHMEGSVFC